MTAGSFNQEACAAKMAAFVEKYNLDDIDGAVAAVYAEHVSVTVTDDGKATANLSSVADVKKFFHAFRNGMDTKDMAVNVVEVTPTPTEGDAEAATIFTSTSSWRSSARTGTCTAVWKNVNGDYRITKHELAFEANRYATAEPQTDTTKKEACNAKKQKQPENFTRAKCEARMRRFACRINSTPGGGCCFRDKKNKSGVAKAVANLYSDATKEEADNKLKVTATAAAGKTQELGCRAEVTSYFLNLRNNMCAANLKFSTKEFARLDDNEGFVHEATFTAETGTGSFSAVWRHDAASGRCYIVRNTVSFHPKPAEV